MSNTSKAMNGGKWITISTTISTLFQFLQVAILARLLEPSAFGIVSVSTLIITFFQIFSNLGFSNSIIYKQESDQRVLSTLYLLNLVVGVIIFIVIQFSTPYIISFYSEPKLDRILRLSSCYFLIAYFGQLYFFLLEKELRFKSVAIIDISGTLVGSVVTITLAYSGYEELSLIVGSLAMQALKSILQIIFGLKFFIPILAFDLTNVKEHLRFGLYNLGDGLLGFIQSNSDNIFIGGMLGVKMLGYYTIAYQLSVFPTYKLNPIILQVAYPILAKMKESNAALKSSYLKILDFISYCNMPLLAGLFITADSVVPLIYGPGWDKTVELIQVFVFVSIFSSLSHPLFTLAFTKGKPNLLFYLNLVTLIIKIPLVYWLGTTWGVMGIATAFLLATLLNLIANFLLVHYLIGNFWADFLRNIAKPILFCLIMIATIYIYKITFGHEGLFNTIAEITLGGLVYGILTLSYKLSFSEIRSYRQSLL
ncbi:MOP flippase family protein [Spirosoma terrae]|uniref:MOP flippase family protein n=1 Tax=Spirosoma terrae TaxID=1968276 RepID=A0A6L9LGV9_9BACT|nr:MOP flippase family protein [Spirosoma terrae]NDU98461.1 MOP flippase family protein [Spirosoma terrae]